MKAFVLLVPFCGFYSTPALAQSLEVAKFERARVLKAANGFLKEAPITITASVSPRSAGGVHEIHRMAVVIGTEGRIKHVQGMRDGHSDIFEGLDFWAPNINIFRDPRWGRGQETFGEDPFLTARMGVAFVTGMEGDDPKYYRVISTPKHFAVHSGPEPSRHKDDIKVSKHDHWTRTSQRSVRPLPKDVLVLSCAHTTASTDNPRVLMNSC
jgi:hypothetical protein